MKKAKYRHNFALDANLSAGQSMKGKQSLTKGACESLLDRAKSAAAVIASTHIPDRTSPARASSPPPRAVAAAALDCEVRRLAAR